MVLDLDEEAGWNNFVGVSPEPTTPDRFIPDCTGEETMKKE